MVIKSFRDVEIQIRKILDELKKTPTSQTLDLEDLVTQDELRSALNIANKPNQKLHADTEVTADGNTILHNFIHRFLNDTYVDGFLVANPLITKAGTYSWSLFADSSTGEFYLEDEGGNEIFRIENPVNGGSFPVDFKFDMHMLPVVTQQNNIGSASKEILKIFTVNEDLSGTLKLSALTASRPLKLNGSKEVISALIDISTDITGTLPVTAGGTGTAVANYTALFPIIADAFGTGFANPVGVYSGTFYVAATSGGPVTTTKTVSNGIVIS
jgi:hypothetical protein